MSVHQRKTNRRNDTPSESVFPSLLRHCAVGALISILVSIVLLLLSALVCLNTENPDQILPYLGYFSILTGLFLSGIFSAFRNKEKGVLCGIISGAMIEFVLLISALAMFDPHIDQSFRFTVTLILYRCGILLSALGGNIGIRLREQKKRRRVKH